MNIYEMNVKELKLYIREQIIGINLNEIDSPVFEQAKRHYEQMFNVKQLKSGNLSVQNRKQSKLTLVQMSRELNKLENLANNVSNEFDERYLKAFRTFKKNQRMKNLTIDEYNNFIELMGLLNSMGNDFDSNQIIYELHNYSNELNFREVSNAVMKAAKGTDTRSGRAKRLHDNLIELVNKKG